MPELPEVHALVADLGTRLIGHTVKRLDMVSFAALKTFDPPASALSGRAVTDVARHGKYLDLVFDVPAEAMWEAAIRRMGADPTMLTISHGVH